MSVHQKKDGRWFVVHKVRGRQVWEAFGRGDEAEKDFPQILVYI